MIRAAAIAALLIPAGWSQLHTSGRYIVDAQGQRVKLAAVNWYGAEEQDFVVAGLDFAPLQQIAHSIKTMGFNAVRLPWSNQMYETNPPIAAARLKANPSLQGSRAMDVFDAVVNALAAEGLYIILDNHTSTADWCCSNGDANAFWYNGAYPESSWLADWQGMASRYANQPAVIGADLRNEPRGPVWGGPDPNYDWHAAAERGGNAVLAGNPNLLIFVEGINYAADLTKVPALPVRLSIDQRVVYSSHDYSWFHNGVGSYNTLKSQLDSKWGFLLDAPVNAPVWVGEFGTCHTSAPCISSNTTSDSGFWFANFRRYLQERDLDWCYWALNGTEATGTSRTLGAEETFGILGKNWTAVASAALLNSLQAMILSTATPAIHPGGIVNGATFQAGVPLVAGSIASIFGTNLAGTTTSAAAFPAPSILGGGQIQTDAGTSVPILFASPGQMNVQIPWEGAASLKSVVGILSSSPEPITVAAAAPVIFMMAAGGTQGAVVIANTAILASAARPAHPGEYISIFCTGLGAVTNQPPTGAAAPSLPLSETIATSMVRIGNIDIAPTFSGLAPGFVGLYQVNAAIPPNAPIGASIPLSITIGGMQSNVVSIAVM